MVVKSNFIRLIFIKTSEDTYQIFHYEHVFCLLQIVIIIVHTRDFKIYFYFWRTFDFFFIWKWLKAFLYWTLKALRQLELFPNYGSADPAPPPLPTRRSGHLDIEDAQFAKKMMGVKYYITSRLGVQTHPNGASKIQLSLKVAKFTG